MYGFTSFSLRNNLWIGRILGFCIILCLQTKKNILSNVIYMSDVCSSYWDTGYDDELIDDRIAMNLLYIQVGLGSISLGSIVSPYVSAC